MTAVIPPSILARIPAESAGKACVCAACAAGGDAEPSVRATVDAGGRPAVLLRCGGDEVSIALLGAQVLSWRRDGSDILWQASRAEFLPGKPVRGGVPLVFPWFGDHPAGGGRPAHGFARNLEWQLAATRPARGVRLHVEQPANEDWPHAFAMDLEVQLQNALTLTWTVHNRGAAPFRFEQALHTYFAVGDVHRASVHGLQGVPSSEHAAAPEAAWDRDAPLHFRAETDRIFQDVPRELRLLAPALGRTVTLTTDNAASAIVWNPWPAKTARLAQMAADDWERFVCIESANVREHAITIPAHGSHTMRLTIAVADLA